MSHSLYDTKIQINEDTYLDNIIDIDFPEDESKYYTVTVIDNQDIMMIAELLYSDVSQWKMLCILNQIEDPFMINIRKIKAIRPEFLQEISND